MPVEQRAREGLFLAFQYPVSLPGVNGNHFLRTAVNALRKHRNEAELSGAEFMRLLRDKTRLVRDGSRATQSCRERWVQRRREETQRGAPDGLARTQAGDPRRNGLWTGHRRPADRVGGVNALRDEQRAFLVITHYQRLLDYIVPDHVHVLVNGRIVQSGGRDLALHLEEHGYGWAEQDQPSAADQASTGA